jgi:2-dehydro-3-deoxyphosphogluconate aldolase / (4S)-4-hydroxy-2-oxoglutarate aldolase
VFGDVRFCPTGGITEATAQLAMASVLCIGGSWIVPKGVPDIVTLELPARRAARLAHGFED